MDTRKILVHFIENLCRIQLNEENNAQNEFHAQQSECVRAVEQKKFDYILQVSI